MLANTVLSIQSKGRRDDVSMERSLTSTIILVHVCICFLKQTGQVKEFKKIH